MNGSSCQADMAATLLDPSLPAPAFLRSWNGSDVADRLAVYRNNVVASLIDALAQTFPVVLELVGEEFFRAMGALFVRQHPPRSRILTHYGDALPAFLERFEPVQGLPYLADVARLEHARVQAYHGAEAPVVSAAQLAAALTAGERIAGIRIDWHPSLAVIDSPFAIVSLFAAHQGALDIASVDPARPETAIVVRDGFDVVVLRGPPGAARFIAAARCGDSLAEAAGQAALADPAFDLAKLLGLLNRHGCIRSIRLPPE